ncbi:ABC-2 type transport system permease protein [Cytobacillus eiseniae]|uniref:ABC-2 type transport system permease protein n=1 Tax=Cytobacillus eiseniae TaxID=762947 RepID=A0ABS4RF61_9BACI|nr:ABC transporter permease [Cytobacillus eiseniae]MBP2240944.1 ABC-2 type transport system permease protein [Cytobacillus eiseniae]
MYSVMMAQWMKEKRKPLLILLFIVISILATVIFGDASLYTQTSVEVYSTEENAEEIEKKWERLLNEASDIEFVITVEEEALKNVSEGKSDVAVRLMEKDYRLITASETPNLQLVEQEVQKVFTKEARLEAMTDVVNSSKLRNEVKDYLENPPIKVQSESLAGEEIPQYNMGMQLLFGFTLFFAMFTIGFKVNGINEDKVSGIWNRLILSPVSKTSMYVGHLIYSFLIGYVQILLVFLIFKYVMGYDIGNLPMILVISAVYTLSMVSLSMLIAGVAKTPEKFNMIFPSIIPIIPIISGIYMPPGTISNPVLQFIGDLFPLSHATEAMMGVALYDSSWNDIALPISLMLLIGVVCMGLGINMVERVKK